MLRSTNPSTGGLIHNVDAVPLSMKTLTSFSSLCLCFLFVFPSKEDLQFLEAADFVVPAEDRLAFERNGHMVARGVFSSQELGTIRPSIVEGDWAARDEVCIVLTYTAPRRHFPGVNQSRCHLRVRLCHLLSHVQALVGFFAHVTPFHQMFDGGRWRAPPAAILPQLRGLRLV